MSTKSFFLQNVVSASRTMNPRGASTFVPMETVVEAFSNTTTWVCPTGVTSVDYLVVGGGGGGGSITAGGGGAGGFRTGTSLSVTPGQTYTVTVGAGGAGATTSGTNVTSGTGANGSSADHVTPLVEASPDPCLRAGAISTWGHASLLP